MGQGQMKVIGQAGEVILVGRMGENNLYEPNFDRVDPGTIADLPKGWAVIHDPHTLASLSNQSATDIHTWH